MVIMPKASRPWILLLYILYILYIFSENINASFALKIFNCITVAIQLHINVNYVPSKSTVENYL